MTVIVQPGTDSNGNPQPMVYDSDTGKVIVDSNGYVLNGGQRLINVPSKTSYVSTPKTQTLGFNEAVNYLSALDGGEIIADGHLIFPADMPSINLVSNIHIKSKNNAILDFSNLPSNRNFNIIQTLNTPTTTTYQNISLENLIIIGPQTSSAYLAGYFTSNVALSGVSGITLKNIIAKNISQLNLSYNSQIFVENIFGQSNITTLTLSICSQAVLHGIETIGDFDDSIAINNSPNYDIAVSDIVVNKNYINNAHGFIVGPAGNGRITISNIITKNNTYLSGTTPVGFPTSPSGQGIQLNLASSPVGEIDAIAANLMSVNDAVATMFAGYIRIANLRLIAGSSSIQGLNINNNNTSTLVEIDGLDIEGTYSSYVLGGNVTGNLIVKNYTGLPAPSISTNPPVSATVYQNTNPYAIEIDLPVYATTAGTAGYVTVAKGSTDTPTAIGNQYVSGDTSDTSEQIIRLRVPANWYYEFTASGVTFGTASVFAD